MKKVTTIFFLFIICIQCLPVKELGKCLFDNTFVEEELCKKGLDKKPFDEIKAFLYASAVQVPLTEKENHFPRLSTTLYPAPAADVTTPPPNA